MGGPQQTRQLGSACRIYKNADDNVIAIDEISIVEETRQLKALKQLRTGRRTSKRTLFHLGGDRVIVTILMIGDYSSLTSDLKEATWTAPNSDTNDVTIGFADMPQVGDSV